LLAKVSRPIPYIYSPSEIEALLSTASSLEPKGSLAEGILRILAKRGISISELQRRRIFDCGDLATLDRWFDRALTVTQIDELFA
jgi:hypothetical protein